VLEEEAALLEEAERSQVAGSKRKEVATGDGAMALQEG